MIRLRLFERRNMFARIQPRPVEAPAPPMQFADRDDQRKRKNTAPFFDHASNRKSYSHRFDLNAAENRQEPNHKSTNRRTPAATGRGEIASLNERVSHDKNNDRGAFDEVRKVCCVPDATEVAACGP